MAISSIAETARAGAGASGADGVMIGRGAQGRPWLLAQIAHALFGTPAPEVPRGRCADRWCATITRICCPFTARPWHRVARKHLGWYMDGQAPPPILRRAVLTAATRGEVLRSAGPRLSRRRKAPHEPLTRDLGLAAGAGDVIDAEDRIVDDQPAASCS
jgi:tRNA-dihydrouridine synthase B